MRYGSLFTGAGGLDLAVHMLWPDAELAWWSEVDESAAASFARHTDAPNLGDITAIDWTSVEPVDVIVGGFPCQDLSVAGKRAGLAGDRSGLWFHMLAAMDALRPSVALLENVTGIYSAGADDDELDVDRDVLDGRAARPARALDVVLGSLAESGWDAEWSDLRASDVGACHRRARWFCVAHDPDRTGGRETLERHGRGTQEGHGAGVPDQPDRVAVGAGSVRGLTLLPTPCVGADRTSRSSLTADGHWSAPSLGQAVELAQGILPREYESWGEVQGWHGALLPTPTVVDMGANKSPDEWDDWTGEMQARHGNGNGHGRSLAIEARLLPTPRATRGGSHTETQNLLPTPTVSQGRNETSGRQPDAEFNTGRTLQDVAYASRWGEYGPAIARWEHVIGRPAPPPTDDEGRLSADFVEWMMGWPPGWTLGVHSSEDRRIYELWLRDGLRGQPPITAMVNSSRSQRLKMCGNGVVPLQAAHAYRQLLDRAAQAQEVAA